LHARGCNGGISARWWVWGFVGTEGGQEKGWIFMQGVSKKPKGVDFQARGGGLNTDVGEKKRRVRVTG